MLTPVTHVPEFEVVDLFDPALDPPQRENVFQSLIEMHNFFFPTYPHAIDDLRVQLSTGMPPEGETVHAWLVMRDGKPIGEWIFNVNLHRGVVLLLFGGIQREAHRDLSRDYLPQLVEFLLGICIRDAHALGFDVHAGIIESDFARLERWLACGFVLVDRDYREPKHGSHWAEFGDIEFLDEYAAIVIPLDAGVGRPIPELAAMALSALLVDHYRLAEDHPEVLSALDRVARMSDTV